MTRPERWLRFLHDASLESGSTTTPSRRINACDLGGRFAQYALAYGYTLVNIARFPTYNGIRTRAGRFRIAAEMRRWLSNKVWLPVTAPVRARHQGRTDRRLQAAATSIVRQSYYVLSRSSFLTSVRIFLRTSWRQRHGSVLFPVQYRAGLASKMGFLAVVSIKLSSRSAPLSTRSSLLSFLSALWAHSELTINGDLRKRLG